MITARSSGEGHMSLIQACGNGKRRRVEVSDRLLQRTKELVETHNHDRSSSMVEPKNVETEKDDGEGIGPDLGREGTRSQSGRKGGRETEERRTYTEDDISDDESQLLNYNPYISTSKFP